MTIIDTWMNLNEPGATEGFSAPHNASVLRQFHRQRDVLINGEPPEQMVARMDANGIDRALITTLPVTDRGGFEAECAAMTALVDSYPSRFAIAPLLPREMGMTSVRAASYAHEQGAAAVRVMPALIGAGPDDRSYYPTFAKCTELNLPITINVGLPGPSLPAWTQNPLLLDQVCRDFPELVVVATHVGDPWTDLLVGLCQRHENLYIKTSAWAPKYYPPAIIQYIRTRGQGRVMFASDHPFIELGRTVKEAAELDMPDAARDEFMFGAALRVFFGRDSWLDK